MDIRTIEIGDANYPVGFYRDPSHSPQTLYYRGNAELLGSMEKSVVVTGSRASTGYGEHIAMDITGALSNSGATIMNGGAYGIDGMALRAALLDGNPTIVWLVGGVDRLYPSGHNTLFQRVLDSGGLIVSDEAVGMSPTKYRMLKRNRLMAMATASVLVVEAGHHSHSLSVAHEASRLGKFVGAIPGPITSASSVGCHDLIRDGVASIVTSWDGVRFGYV
jgi:DNA processing protein